MKKAYIAGKITNDPNYRNKFAAAEKGIRKMGYVVMSPAIMPDGFEYEDYMTVCFAMLSICDVIFMLPDWAESDGAKVEHEQARKTNKRIEHLTEEDMTAWLELAS